jgi:hypothetical protein
MNVNPDPRPGRWMLPLVVLGMVTFTWVFVNQLPGEGQAAEDDPSELPADSTSSTTTPDGTQDDESEPTTGDTAAEGGPTDTAGTDAPEAQNYLDAMGVLGAQLTTFQAEMATVNAGWDADPKELTLDETEERLTTLSTDVEEWAQQVAAVEVPPDFADAHQQMLEAAQAASSAAAAALDGLVNAPTAEPRLAAVGNFDQAVASYQEALTAAGG